MQSLGIDVLFKGTNFLRLLGGLMSVHWRKSNMK